MLAMKNKLNKYMIGAGALFLPAIAMATPADDVSALVDQADVVWVKIATLSIAIIGLGLIVRVVRKLRG